MVSESHPETNTAQVVAQGGCAKAEAGWTHEFYVHGGGGSGARAGKLNGEGPGVRKGVGDADDRLGPRIHLTHANTLRGGYGSGWVVVVVVKLKPRVKHLSHQHALHNQV